MNVKYKFLYLAILTVLTAVLFQGACRISAVLAEASEKEETALSDYGFHLGMAFPMVDDLLDYTFDSDILGKVVGADLKEGKLTLPIIYALKRVEVKDREKMEKLISDKNFSEDDFKWLVEKIQGCGGIDDTRKLAGDHIDTSIQALSQFEPSQTRDILCDIARYVVGRKH